ncbi:MAG TPA: hypothetical protein VLS96_03125 [Nodosilinea sp.]|nr:hypothetical protein [Nodosilinea sp.]
MGEPSNLLLKLSRRLWADAGEREAFVAALMHPQPFPTGLLWMQARPAVLPVAIAPPLPWQPAWVDRIAADQRPGHHPLHQAGAYYCLDMASVFAASVFSAIPSRWPQCSTSAPLRGAKACWPARPSTRPTSGATKSSASGSKS